MENKEELLQYLRTNYSKPGHALYHVGKDTIHFIFGNSLKVEDIQDFVERNHAYTIFKETKKGALNPIYKRFKRQQFQIDLLEIKKISKENKGFNFLLTVIDVYTKFAWVVPLPNKKSNTVLEAFKDIISNLNEKPLNIVSDLSNNFTTINRSFFSPVSKKRTHTFFGRGGLKKLFVVIRDG